MISKILVRVLSVRYQNGELFEDFQEFECESLINATRIVLQFKPKRGYRVDEIKIQYVDVLV